MERDLRRHNSVYILERTLSSHSGDRGVMWRARWCGDQRAVSLGQRRKDGYTGSAGVSQQQERKSTRTQGCLDEGAWRRGNDSQFLGRLPVSRLASWDGGVPSTEAGRRRRDSLEGGICVFRPPWSTTCAVTWGPALGFMLPRHHLETLNAFLTKGPACPFCAGTNTVCARPCLWAPGHRRW